MKENVAAQTYENASAVKVEKWKYSIFIPLLKQILFFKCCEASNEN
jgi:hypothetical protein